MHQELDSQKPPKSVIILDSTRLLNWVLSKNTGLISSIKVSIENF